MGYARKSKNFIHHHFRRFCYWLGPTRCILFGAAILFFSFLVQLLTSIGVPYILSFDFFRFDLQNFTFIELGMWAACNGKEALIIPTISLTEQPEEFNCPPAAWGWIDSRYAGITEVFFDKNLPKALIMHPISCCFTFFAMVTALITMKRQKQHFLLPIFSFFSCLFALASFLIDVATFLPARHKLLAPDAVLTLGTTVTSTSLGPAFWLSLSCFVLDIFGNAVIISGYGIWRSQREKRENSRFSSTSKEEIGLSPFDDSHTASTKKAGSRLSRRGYFNDSTASFTDHSPYTLEDEDEKVEVRSTSSRILLENNNTSSNPNVNIVQELPIYPESSRTNKGVEDHHEQEEEDDVEEFNDVNDDEDEVGSEDGYDSAMSAYADAKSEVEGGRSRSRVTLNSPSGDLNNRRSVDTRRSTDGQSSSQKQVKRKPVSGY